MLANAGNMVSAATVTLVINNEKFNTIFDSISSKNGQLTVLVNTLWPGMLFYFGTNVDEIIINNDNEKIIFKGAFRINGISFDCDEKNYVVNIGAKHGKFTKSKS